ncbi:MAG: RHS repeat-associated core domain-containing protein [Bacteroidota bacterium]|nr:RHS repeat-associated core domain-containing protein [Bacteroidota bacterium]
MSNQQGEVVEKRLFDAWGKVLRVEDGKGRVLSRFVVLDRGYTGHEHLWGVGLIHMNGRLYDANLHRFLQPDNYVQDPFNTQNYNRYGYCLNNPFMYTDPSGEWVLVDDIVSAVVGGVINLVANAIQGNVTSIGSGIGYFFTGAAAGIVTIYAGPVAGGAVMGLGNTLTSQVSQNGWNNVNVGSVIAGTAVGALTSYLGGQISGYVGGAMSRMVAGISSPVAKQTVVDGVSNAISGFAVAGGMVYVETGDLDAALSAGGQGALFGGGLGLMTGGLSGYKYAIEKGIDPWTGKSIIDESQLYEIGDGVRRAKILESLGEKSVLAEDNSGRIFEVPVKNLRSNFKRTLPYDKRYQQLFKTIKYEGQKFPIYVSPGNKGIPINKVKLK